jgi:L-fucose dehydrogenase
MDLHLANKVFVVTGGAKGIGYGIARQLAQEGAIPVILGRSGKDNESAVQQINAEGFVAHHVVVELTDPEDCKRSVESVIQKTGRIDGLVNNAGLNDGVSLENGDYTSFMESLHNTLVHYFLLAHFCLPELKISQGTILNITSKTAETGQGNTSGYAAANGGRNALTREWAVDLLKYNIRVNAIQVAECWTPQYENWIKQLPDSEHILRSITSKIPLGQRMTTIDEIAAMTVFLLSPRSSHTTGQIIHVDGGYVHLDRALVNS